MYGLERYYKSHLRSLFISRFNYSSHFAVLKLTGLRVVLRTPMQAFTLAIVFSFLLLRKWPQIFQQQSITRTKGGNVTTRLVLITQLYDNFSIYFFINRLFILYFPSIEAWSTSKRALFTSSWRGTRSVSIKLRAIFYIFFELDFLVNFAFTFLKSFTSTWSIEIFLIINSSNRFMLKTIARSFYFPI